MLKDDWIIRPSPFVHYSGVRERLRNISHSLDHVLAAAVRRAFGRLHAVRRLTAHGIVPHTHRAGGDARPLHLQPECMERWELGLGMERGVGGQQGGEVC